MEFYSKEVASKLDEVSINNYRISVEKLMENSGSCVARFVIENFSATRNVVVVYGKGNNAGDGLVAARHLNSYGINVKLLGLKKEKLNIHAKKELETLEKLKIPKINNLDNLKKGDIIIDALFGYNLTSEPRNDFKLFIQEINKAREKGVKIISIDIPSGIDSNKGQIYKTFVKSNYTLMLALPKIGLKEFNNLYLANIGIPKKVYEDLDIKPPEFKKEVMKV